MGRRRASVRTACHSGRACAGPAANKGTACAHTRGCARARTHVRSCARTRATRRSARERARPTPREPELCVCFCFLARLSCSRLFFKIDQPLQWTAAQAACVEQVRVLTRTARRRHAGTILHKRAPHPTRCQARPRSRCVVQAVRARLHGMQYTRLHSPNAGLALLGRDAVQGGDLASIHSDEEFAAAVSDGKERPIRRGVSHLVY